MGQRDDKDQPAPVCGTCMGAQGEWVSRNGTGPKQTVWIPCKTCQGTGRK